MASAAQHLHVSGTSSWHISRDGLTLALVDLTNEGGCAEVTTNLAAGSQTHCFETLLQADAFVSDLIASFSYLGCDVAAA